VPLPLEIFITWNQFYPCEVFAGLPTEALFHFHPPVSAQTSGLVEISYVVFGRLNSYAF